MSLPTCGLTFLHHSGWGAPDGKAPIPCPSRTNPTARGLGARARGCTAARPPQPTPPRTARSPARRWAPSLGLAQGGPAARRGPRARRAGPLGFSESSVSGRVEWQPRVTRVPPTAAGLGPDPLIRAWAGDRGPCVRREAGARRGPSCRRLSHELEGRRRAAPRRAAAGRPPTCRTGASNIFIERLRPHSLAVGQ